MFRSSLVPSVVFLFPKMYFGDKSATWFIRVLTAFIISTGHLVETTRKREALFWFAFACVFFKTNPYKQAFISWNTRRISKKEWRDLEVFQKCVQYRLMTENRVTSWACKDASQLVVIERLMKYMQSWKCYGLMLLLFAILHPNVQTSGPSLHWQSIPIKNTACKLRQQMS